MVGNVAGMFDAVDEAHGDVIIEEFLAGAEGCVTVLPPLKPGGEGVALPVVLRKEQASIASRDETESSSRVVEARKGAQDPWFEIVKEECARAVEVLGLTTVARVDFRRKMGEDPEVDSDGEGEGKFYLFGVNLVPVPPPPPLFFSLCCFNLADEGDT